MHLTRVGGGVESREWKIEIRKMGDSQTFVKALSDWSSKKFFGVSNVIFVPSLYYFWPKKPFFLPFSRFF